MNLVRNVASLHKTLPAGKLFHEKKLEKPIDLESPVKTEQEV